jgi:uncharacterized membrane protein
MAGKSKKQRKARTVETTKPRSRDLILGLLGGLGLVLTTGLLAISMTQSSLPYCGGGSGCDVVQNSRWSVLFGLPIAAWGWCAYFVIASVALFSTRNSSRSQITIVFATVGFAVSVYLNVVAFWVLKAICAYCLASFLLVTAIYALSWRNGNVFGLNSWRFGSSAIAILMVVVMHLHYAGKFNPAAGPEDPYLQALAEHLSESDVKFYGAYWCPHCQEQKLAFGASAKRLPYVECSPNGQRAAPATDCLGANVRNYPTWVIGKRRLERALSAAQLARYSSFRPPPSQEIGDGDVTQ